MRSFVETLSLNLRMCYINLHITHSLTYLLTYNQLISVYFHRLILERRSLPFIDAIIIVDVGTFSDRLQSETAFSLYSMR